MVCGMSSCGREALRHGRVNEAPLRVGGSNPAVVRMHQ